MSSKVVHTSWLATLFGPQTLNPEGHVADCQKLCFDVLREVKSLWHVVVFAVGQATTTSNRNRCRVTDCVLHTIMLLN